MGVVKERCSFLFPLFTLHVIFGILDLLLLLLPLSVHCQCTKNPIIFNFGDSNSDTGGYADGLGLNFAPPNGRTYFHQPAGRISDGRLIIDFLCESLKIGYLTPYLNSLGPNFTNGANFAISGSATLPRFVPFSLDIQVSQFLRFRSRSPALMLNGYKDLVGDGDFQNALYTIDIGQNDLAGSFDYLTYSQVFDKIPSFITEIKYAIWFATSFASKIDHLNSKQQNDLLMALYASNLTYAPIAKQIPSFLVEIKLAIQVLRIHSWLVVAMGGLQIIKIEKQGAASLVTAASATMYHDL
ncbi:hypothetical protein REPUB_Repub12eG0139300 [Reevesia pubescens]